jgi:hypothetical protein
LLGWAQLFGSNVSTKVAMYAWRSIYWSEQVSTRTRALLMFDWIIRYDLSHSSSTMIMEAYDYLVVFGDVISRSCRSANDQRNYGFV